jgi:hypothetical protein
MLSVITAHTTARVQHHVLHTTVEKENSYRRHAIIGVAKRHAIIGVPK